MALLEGNSNVTILKSSNDFSIYSLNGNDICLFAVPERVNGSLALYLDLNMEENYKGILNGTKTQQQVIELIEKDYDLLDNTYKNSVYVVPNFNTSNLENVLGSNDKQAIFSFIGNLANFTKSIQSVLNTKGVPLDTKINVVVKNDVDNKLANWLETQNIGKGVSFNELKSQNQVMDSGNPFMNSATVAANPFDNLQVDQKVSVQSTNQEQALNIGDAVEQNKVDDNSQVVQEPVPVQGVTLESGFDNSVENLEQPKIKSRKLGNRGYVNIVVLLAVIVGVTFISIQLGKFLYSIYG